jgi:hypothetical protein
MQMLVRQKSIERKTIRMRQLIPLTAALLWLGILPPESSAVAQDANDQFRGSSWRLVSGGFERAGRKVHLTPPRLQGFLMFDSGDHFLIAITRSRQAGTQGENATTLQRNVACFGTYSIDRADHTINVHIEGSTFPKWTGTDQKRRFIVAGDDLKWTNSSSAGAPGTAELAWKRVK